MEERICEDSRFVREYLFRERVFMDNERTVYPGEQHISVIISLNGGEGQNAQSAYKYRRLREILTRYPAFDAAMHDQKAKGDTAEGPGQTEISLKQDHRVPKAFFFGLVRLKKRKIFFFATSNEN